jgi:DNA polymerase elongation subunit (family B)
MTRDNDNLYTIPLTSTGYVRRDVKAVLRDWGSYKVKELLPDIEVYTLLREAFRGGNTHANRYFVKNPEYPLPPIENVHSADRSSSYPDVQVNYMFPMSPFRRVEKEVTYTQLKQHYIERRGYALVFRLQIDNLELQDYFNPCPYISYDKARNVRGKMLDNGRLLGADHCEITITDIDFKIIDKQYKLSDGNTVITDLYFAHYDFLPDELRELVKGYYIQKTALKGIEDQQLYYDKYKNLINSVYGCSAQDPAKDNILYLEDAAEDNIYQCEGVAIVDILAAARPTMPYQWGVWTTARARERLQIMIDAVHENAGSEFVYTDTDSVKYIGEYNLELINKELRQLAINNGAFADDIKGVRHYMGIYEYEGTYKRFETMGAKSYVYEDENGGLHITIAGVPKKAGAAELENMGGFSAYQVGATFHDGVTETKYNDTRQYTETTVDGHGVEITSNMIIKDSFHQIGFAQDYSILLSTLTKKDIDRIRAHLL